MILINGEQRDSLPTSDRAIHYGDGLFETIAVVNAKPRLWSAHMERLALGCERLKITPPDFCQLHDEVLAAAGAEERAVIKIIYSRGSGGRGYRLPDESSPRRIVIRYPWPDFPESGIRLRFCRTPLACNPALAGIKHLNRLEQVMARAEWSEPDIQEGVMCDLDGRVKEGTMSNLFWVRGSVLYTPDLSSCGVQGVMRAQVIECAAELGIDCVSSEITDQALLEVDEIAISNALIGLCPVSQLAGHQLPSSELVERLRVALNTRLEAME